MPRATVTEAFDIGSGVAPPPPNSGIDGPGVAAVTITTVPESTWVVVHASGSITLVPNPDCHGFCPTTSPTFQFSPTPNVSGPVVVAANTGGPDDFFRMRGSGGTGESGGSAVGLQFVPKGAAIRARINIPESIRGYDPLTGSNAPSWLMSGGYGITATAVPSGIAVTESAPAPDGTITYKVAPIMDLAFFNPINLGGPSVPQGAITWNYFVGDTADHTRPSGATYEITECQFQTECRWKPPAPGRMQVHAYVEMQSVYARSKPLLQPTAQLLLRCNGATDSAHVTRAAQLRCVASANGPGTLEVTGWTFESPESEGAQKIVRDAASRSSREWTGIVVITGRVTVTGTINGRDVPAANFDLTVDDRHWPEAIPPRFTRTQGCERLNLDAEASQVCVLLYPPDTLGHLARTMFFRHIDRLAPRAAHIDTGPNAGFSYVSGTASPIRPDSIVVYLNRVLADRNDQFWRKQNVCTFEQLSTSVPAHEKVHADHLEATVRNGIANTYPLEHRVDYVSLAEMRTRLRAAEIDLSAWLLAAGDKNHLNTAEYPPLLCDVDKILVPNKF